jgi:hypothetical protein
MTKIFRKKEWESLAIQRDPTTRVNQGLINYLNEQERENKKQKDDNNKLIRKNKDIKKKN